MKRFFYASTFSMDIDDCIFHDMASHKFQFIQRFLIHGPQCLLEDTFGHAVQE